MGKTASEVGLYASQRGVLFRNIVVYGFLVDYTSGNIAVTMKMKMDFVHCISSIKEFQQPLDITDGFERATAAMSQAMVKKTGH